MSTKTSSLDCKYQRETDELSGNTKLGRLDIRLNIHSWFRSTLMEYNITSNWKLKRTKTKIKLAMMEHPKKAILGGTVIWSAADRSRHTHRSVLYSQPHEAGSRISRSIKQHYTGHLLLSSDKHKHILILYFTLWLITTLHYNFISCIMAVFYFHLPCSFMAFVLHCSPCIFHWDCANQSTYLCAGVIYTVYTVYMHIHIYILLCTVKWIIDHKTILKNVSNTYVMLPILLVLVLYCCF